MLEPFASNRVSLMKFKTILIVVVLVIVSFVAFKMLSSDNTTTQEDSVVTTPQKNQDTVTIVDNIDDDPRIKLITEYTAQIEAGDIDNGNIYYKRGIEYLNTKQYRSAIYDFTNTLRYTQDSAYPYYNRALAYMALDDYIDALDDLNAALKIKPDFADALNASGLANVELGNFSAALENYEAAIKFAPTLADIYFNKGTLFMRQEQYLEAKEAFQQAIDNNQTAKEPAAKNKLMQAYLNLARAKFVLQEYESALHDATKAIEINSKSPQALRIRAEIYERMGNSSAAAADLAAADTLDMERLLNGNR